MLPTPKFVLAYNKTLRTHTESLWLAVKCQLNHFTLLPLAVTGHLMHR